MFEKGKLPKRGNLGQEKDFTVSAQSLIKIKDDTSDDVPKKATKGSRLTAGTSNEHAIDVDGMDDSVVRTGKGTKPSSRVSYKNADLPDGAHRNNTWKGVVLPTLLKYMGTRINPWTISDREFLSILQRVWTLAYGDDLKYNIEINDSVHGLASQRVYEWRNMFGTTAIRVFEMFFKTFNGGRDYSDLRSRKKFGQGVMIDAAVLYKTPGVKKHKGLYRSDFVIASLNVHLEAIEGALNVPGLYEQPLDAYPYGAVGLAAAAACRAAMLYGTGKIAYSQPKDKVVILKPINVLSGKESKETDFSVTNYGDATKKAAARCQSLPWKKMQAVYQDAVGFRATSVPYASNPGDNMAIDIDFANLDDDNNNNNDDN
ncbi:hypothetical protein C8Q80DRAFT_1272874 [Daedaleopsis nitida]|nr:hypothetical protein C8Q80DRAFT_1272874 [Daedaleopsis nitida]